MSDRFLAARWRIRLAGGLGVALPVMGVYQLSRPPDWSGLATLLAWLTGCCFVALGGVFARALLRRARPVLEVGDEVLEFDPLFGFARRRIALAEISDVDRDGSRMILTLRSSPSVALNLGDLEAGSRSAACDAVARRLPQR